jgi:anaerobic ribonucleoside-triphosphate reductase
MKYLDKQYISLTDEEKVFEETRKNLENVISKMLQQSTLSQEMINDNLIKNLTKYRLDELKEKVLIIKYPPEDDARMRHLSEDEIMRLAFEKEI